jgi:tetratricopeptide (TPR) repeat protein
MEKVRRDLLNSALDFYKGFLEQRNDDPEVRWQTGRAYLQVANIQRLLGETEKVTQAYTEAQKMLGALVREVPKNPEYRLDLARTHIQKGEFLRSRNAQESEKEYLDAIELCHQIVFAANKETGGQEEQESGHVGASVSVAARRTLATAYSGLGVTQMALGGKVSGEKALKEAMAVQAGLVDAYPATPEYTLDLAKSYNDQAVRMQTRGRLEESEQAYAKAAARLEPLIERHGKVGPYQNEHLRACSNRATVLQYQGKFAEAEQLFRQVSPRREQLTKDFPSVTDYQFEKARNLFLLAALLQDAPAAKPEVRQVRLKESEELHRQALEQFRKLVEASPRDPDYQHGVTSCLNRLADLLRITNRGADGVRLWEEAVTLLDTLVREFPGQVLYLTEEARALHNLGVTLGSLKRFPEAEEYLKSAVTLRERLSRDLKEEPDHRINHAKSVGELGVVHGYQNHLDQAETLFRDAIALLKQADEKIPNQPEIWKEEIIWQTNLARLLKPLGKDNAVKGCEKRIEELKQKLAKRGEQAPQGL